MRRDFAIILFGIFVTTMSLTLAKATPPVSAATPAVGTVVLSPCEFGGDLDGQQGLILVPENRAAKTSRLIAVHFLLFPAREPGSLPPVFILPGGPGDFVDESYIRRRSSRANQYSLVSEIRGYGQKRDVIILNQRGNSEAPGLHSNELKWRAPGGQPDKPKSIEESSRKLAEGAKNAFDLWQSRGMDLAGYDIINMVDDIDDLRKALGHEKIALRGGSFGSQWSLAYMKRWPDHVDRALLGGVEPLDHGYDSPQGIWSAFERLEKRVVADGRVKLPKEGLLGALKATITRLEEEPAVYKLRHPQLNVTAEVTIGADDVRFYLNKQVKGSLRQSLEAWPRFILEMYNEKYDLVAAKTIDRRRKGSSNLMIGTLVDNSLGISAAREERLKNEPARRWLGGINLGYVATRGVTPTPVVDDEFRKFSVSEIPVLMVQGDLDLSTPLENAQELLEYLPNGHLIRVNGGTHGAIGDIASADRKFMNNLFLFMNADFEATDVKTLLGQLPDSVEMPPLKFETTDGRSIYEEMTKRK